jgi:hypothetical protein
VTLPLAPVAPHPADRATAYTYAWIAWIAAFAVLEARAIRQDGLSPDRAKRTLSSNLRWWTAWDTITGQPLDVPGGRLRRLAFIASEAWFNWHITKPGSM